MAVTALAGPTGVVLSATLLNVVDLWEGYLCTPFHINRRKQVDAS
jgi:hypothetical protein